MAAISGDLGLVITGGHFPRTLKVTRKRPIKLTKFEMEIMDALWGLGRGSIREVHESLPEAPPSVPTVRRSSAAWRRRARCSRPRQIGHAHLRADVHARRGAQAVD